MRIKASLLLCACLLLVSPVWCQTFGADLETAFRSPRDEDKPWAYWWWLKGNVDEASITRDLEALKAVGFGGLLHFDVRGYHEDHVPPPESRVEFMSPEWRRLLKHALAECERLGLKISVNLSSSAGALKGPWDVGRDAPKRLMWTAAELRGPRRVECVLRPPGERLSWDVAVLAVRHEPSRNEALAPAGPIDLSSHWREARPTLGSQGRAIEVVDLTDRVDAQGRLAWDAPEGHWSLVRFAAETMAGHETDVDILSASAVAGFFDRMGRAILDDAGPAAGSTLTHFYSVSWEGATPMWTPGLDEAFVQAHGYRPRPYLPVLAGWTIRSRDVSERFLRDDLTTLGDLFRDNLYGTLQRLCHEAGLRWHSESGGPWDRNLPTFKNADQLAFLARNDMPQGEFWFGRTTQTLNRPIAMAAHTYGRPLAAAEAFTHMVQHWSAYPAVLKPCADVAFTDGINQLIWHTFTASPPEFGQPGSEYFAGTHINPNVTWFRDAGPFVAYLARCQVLLRPGQFVADVCAYTGENPYLHWGRASKWGPHATQVLGKGYTYDLINNEVLLDRLAVRDGRLVLPDGMSYRLLVVDLDDETAAPAALRKVLDLARAGATVVLGAREPRHAPGLAGYPASDDEVRRLAAELWGDGQPWRTLGQGAILAGTPVDEAIRALKILPDFEGPYDYVHRRVGDTDLYFLAGSGPATCTFRVPGKEPELWDPVTGRIRDALLFRATTDGRTVVPLDLPASGSLCVVFRRPAQSEHLAAIAGPEQGIEIEGRVEAGARVTVWRTGTYTVTTSSAATPVQVEAEALPEPLTLAGPWDVHFQPGRGAPASATFPDLIAWDRHADPRIKYFSGTATYRRALTLTDDQARHRLRLQLGSVHCLARVRVNGADQGVVWTAPWTLDLTGVLKPGDNLLEIDVTNLWVNRLIGDAALPEAERLTKTNVALRAGGPALKPYQGFLATDPLLPSGLLGPVLVEFGTRRDIPLR